MKYMLSFLMLAGLSACGVAEGAMDRDSVGQTYIIDHGDYIGQVYWQ